MRLGRFLAAGCLLGGALAGSCSTTNSGSIGATKSPRAIETATDNRTTLATHPARGNAGANAAPDFELDTLTGDALRLSKQAGQVVLLDFWATYCEPCLRAMPHLNQLFQRHSSQGFQIWAISIDGPDSVAQVRAQVSKLGVAFPVLLDQDSRVVALYNPKTSAPFSVLIGRDGRVLKQYEGYSATTGSSLEADVVQALGGATPPAVQH
jgi:peroxiredoxin